MNEIYHHALKLLRRKDYSETQLRKRLEEKFGKVPDEITAQLRAKRFIDDRRFSENHVAKHADGHPDRIRVTLEDAGVPSDIIEEVVTAVDWPSLQEVVKAKMITWRLHPPLARRDAARLFRTLSRLGYPEEEIREELEQLHEQ